MVQENKDIAKILIVDDVETNRFVLRDIITEMGYRPILAESGKQALKVVERLWPQLIILDIAMPEMNGYEVCEKIKSDPKMREIPIIFISALENPEDVVKGFEVGGEDYVTKPFLPEVVKARVGLHLKLNENKTALSELNRQLQTSISEQLSQLEMEKKNVLYALARVARENAAYDDNHMERLCENCKIISEALQLSPEYGDKISDTFIDTIEIAAPLCDLGNVAIPTDILQKKSSVNDEEKEIIKKHTVIGARIIDDVQTAGDYNDFLKMSYEIAFYHHENWDGTGYPNQLKEDEIPISAQIVHLMGDYCALTEKRSYRDAYNKEEAIKMLSEHSGTKYNEIILDVLKMIIRRVR